MHMHACVPMVMMWLLRNGNLITWAAFELFGPGEETKLAQRGHKPDHLGIHKTKNRSLGKNRSLWESTWETSSHLGGFLPPLFREGAAASAAAGEA